LRARARATTAVTALVLSIAPIGSVARIAAQGLASTTITGIVTDAISGRPIASATVFLEGQGTSKVATTDASGVFSFAVSDAEQFVVRAGKPGYFEAEVALDASSPARVTNPHAPRLQLRLWRYASVSGVVRDAQGRTVEQAVVSVWPRIFVAGAVQIAKGTNVRTDDRGEYSLSGLQQGEYLVSVRPRLTPGAQVPPLVFFPDAASVDQSQPVVLGPGEQRSNIDFTIAQLPGRTVAGAVSAAFALSGALQVSLVPDGLNSAGTDGAIAQMVPDAHGGFSFAGVPPGAYWLIVDSAPPGITYGGDGGIPMLLSLNGISLPPKLFRTRGPSPTTRISGRVSIVVDRRDVHDVVIPLQSGASISGQIVVDDQSAKRPAFRLIAEPADGDVFRGVAAATVQWTDGAGAFAISGLNEGAFFFNLSSPGGLTIQSITIRNREMNGDPITVRAGENIEDVRVALTVRPPLLTGSVRNQAGESLYVLAFPVNDKMWQQYGLNPARMRTVPVSTAGTFRVDDLPAGDYLVAAVDAYHRNDWRDPQLLRKLAPRSKHVSLTWGGTQAVDLDPPR
jgi:hypothetical protein